ncbi:hypothetical protein [Acetobacter cerevisiae]|uniref:Uncharacterized protein n=1 Tax=Acetobacter cerevisiae TaxID=178900 RepID=A0A149VD85_9PROT|nr:hypothetical protein [Acetobacter cerevisiae]KXV78201.1 hypothetical protein AD954_04025 [Acetobacter cerevisiae]
MPAWPGSPDPTPVTPGHRNRRIDLLRGIAYPLGHSALGTVLPPGTLPQTGFERLAVLPVFLIGSGLLASLISRHFSEPLNRTLRQRLGRVQKTC